jgi:hypothetical protein
MQATAQKVGDFVECLGVGGERRVGYLRITCNLRGNTGGNQCFGVFFRFAMQHITFRRDDEGGR